MMKKNFPWAVLAALTLLFACQKTDPVPQPEPDPTPVDNYEATITLTESTDYLDADAGSTANLVFACDHQWTLEIPEEAAGWLSSE